MLKESPVIWRAFGRSIRGASHEKRGLENQDALLCVAGEDVNSPVIVAVSDGHGSSSCYRSGAGAELAVEVTAGCVSRLFTNKELADNMMALKDFVHDGLAREIHVNWKEAVDRHLTARSSKISLLLNNKAPSGSTHPGTDANPYLIYGATILCVGLLGQTAVFIQLGDGDILVVTSGKSPQRLLPDDNKVFANETTSLCMADAWRHFRVRVMELDDTNTPDLILIASDGYSNSFPDCDSDFLKIGADYLDLIQSKGYEAVCGELDDILMRTSQKGSRDDITMGMIYRSR